MRSPLYPDGPLVSVCMYNRSRFPENVCRDALRSHPLVVVGERVCENLFYDLDEAALGRASAKARIDRMLAHIARAAEADEEWPAPDGAEAHVATEAASPWTVGGRLRRRDARCAPLSPRQVDVAVLIADGLTNEQIARRLALTPGTVGNHVEHILRRLDLRSRTQVGVWAVRRGLVAPDGGDESPDRAATDGRLPLTRPAMPQARRHRSR